MISNTLVKRVNLTGLSRVYSSFIDSIYKSKLLFVHVPKSGGTSLSHSLRAKFPLSYFKLEEAPTNDVCRNMSFQQLTNFKCRIMAYHAAMNKHFLQGHFPVTNETLKSDFAGYKAVTLLRDPVERIISHYHFDKRLSAMTPEEFLESKRGFAETHILCHYFGGLPFDVESLEDKAASVAQTAQSAIETLEEFSVVGILENEESFLRDLRSQAGLKIAMPKRNVGKDKLASPKVFTGHLLDKLIEMTAKDREIYEFFRNRASLV